MKHTIQIIALAGALCACGDQYSDTLAAAKEQDSRDQSAQAAREAAIDTADTARTPVETTQLQTPPPVDPHDIDTRPTSPLTTDAQFEGSNAQPPKQTPNGKDTDSAAASDALFPPGVVPETEPETTADSTPDTSPSTTTPVAQPDANSGSVDATKNDETPKPLDVDKLSEEDAEFVAKASVAARFEVESSELAVLQAQTPEIRDFAQLMVTDHGAALSDLEDLASQKGAKFPKDLDAEHKGRLSNLRDLHGIEFDRQYRDIQITAHRDAIALFERAAKDSEDAEVKALAERLLPTLRQHEEKLNAIPPTEG
jgi:predicted outer membrane protein